jgi:hypothetical protein
MVTSENMVTSESAESIVERALQRLQNETLKEYKERVEEEQRKQDKEEFKQELLSALPQLEGFFVSREWELIVKLFPKVGEEKVALWSPRPGMSAPAILFLTQNGLYLEKPNRMSGNSGEYSNVPPERVTTTNLEGILRYLYGYFFSSDQSQGFAGPVEITQLIISWIRDWAKWEARRALRIISEL